MTYECFFFFWIDLLNDIMYLSYAYALSLTTSDVLRKILQILLYAKRRDMHVKRHQLCGMPGTMLATSDVNKQNGCPATIRLRRCFNDDASSRGQEIFEYHANKTHARYFI